MPRRPPGRRARGLRRPPRGRRRGARVPGRRRDRSRPGPPLARRRKLRAAPGEARATARVAGRRAGDHPLRDRGRGPRPRPRAVDAAAPACVAAKPQLAFFEQLGFAGWLALEHVCAHARVAGLLVIADGKRGDVPSTAAAYSRALRPGARPGRRRHHRQPVDGPRCARAADRRARARAAPARSCSCAPPTPARPMCSTSSSPPASRCGSASPAMAAELGQGEPLADVGAVTGATCRSTSRACAS